MPVFGAPVISIVRGSGTELWDTDGKRYLDFLSGLAVIVARARQPGDRRGDLPTRRTRCCTSATCSPTRRRRDAAVKVNELLLEATGHDGQVFFCNSGAEANEARSSWPASSVGAGATPWSARSGSFHGRTLATLAATGQPAKHEPFSPMPDGFRHVAWDDLDALGRASTPPSRRS